MLAKPRSRLTCSETALEASDDKPMARLMMFNEECYGKIPELSPYERCCDNVR